MTYKTQGFIIRQQNLSESDKILTIYTKNKGKIQVVAKGLRKILSKLAGHVELLNLADLMIAHGKSLDRLAGAELINSYPKLRNDFKKITQAYTLIELIDNLIKDKEPSEDIFSLIEDSFKEIEDNNNSTLIVHFFIKLISLLGHLPELNYCVHCRKIISKKSNSFSYSLGGVIDKDCLSFDKNAFEISNSTILVLKSFIKNDISTEKIKINKFNSVELKTILVELSQSISERKLKSAKFLKM